MNNVVYLTTAQHRAEVAKARTRGNLIARELWLLRESQRDRLDPVDRPIEFTLTPDGAA